MILTVAANQTVNANNRFILKLIVLMNRIRQVINNEYHTNTRASYKGQYDCILIDGLHGGSYGAASCICAAHIDNSCTIRRLQAVDNLSAVIRDYSPGYVKPKDVRQAHRGRQGQAIIQEPSCDIPVFKAAICDLRGMRWDISGPFQKDYDRNSGKIHIHKTV